MSREPIIVELTPEQVASAIVQFVVDNKLAPDGAYDTKTTLPVGLGARYAVRLTPREKP